MNPTHYGSLHGIPVLIDLTDDECPAITGRYFWCDAALEVMEALFSAFVWMMTYLDDEYEPVYAIKLTGEIRDTHPD